MLLLATLPAHPLSEVAGVTTEVEEAVLIVNEGAAQRVTSFLRV